MNTSLDITTITFVSLVVVVVTDAIKEIFPQIEGNVTRLLALVIGGLIGALGQSGLINAEIDVISGVIAGVSAIAGNTLITKVGVAGVPDILEPPFGKSK